MKILTRNLLTTALLADLIQNPWLPDSELPRLKKDDPWLGVSWPVTKAIVNSFA